MAETVFVVGIVTALFLIPLLLRTAWERQFRIWPTPGPGTWQSITFWTLFRILNVATLTSAIIAVADNSPPAFGSPEIVRTVAFALMLLALFLYGQSLMSLGKKNTYCDRDGLITHGIYRWTRNPQYATIIPFYCFLAATTDASATYVLAVAMCTVYYLMAVVEEPWLVEAYGKPYIDYCRRVPRFFNFRRGAIWIQAQLRALQRRASIGQG